MNGFKYIYGATLAQVLMAANEIGVNKDDFVSIEEENGSVVLIYFDNKNGDD